MAFIAKTLDPGKTELENHDENISDIMDALNEIGKTTQATKTLPLAQTQKVTIPYTSLVYNGTYSVGSATFTHGLGYQPVVVAYYSQAVVNNVPVPYALLPYAAGDGFIGFTDDYVIDLNTITVTTRIPRAPTPTDSTGYLFFVYKQPITAVNG